jgi:hypothetical protein
VSDRLRKIRAGKNKKKRIVTGFTNFAGRVILLADDLVIVEGLASPGEKSSQDPRFAHYRIQPFGFKRRSLLVERWLMLDPDVDTDGVSFAHELSTAERSS